MPTAHEVRRHHDQDPITCPPKDELLRVEARHDRLPRSGIIGEQEAEPWLREKLVVHSLELVR